MKKTYVIFLLSFALASCGWFHKKESDIGKPETSAKEVTVAKTDDAEIKVSPTPEIETPSPEKVIPAPVTKKADPSVTKKSTPAAAPAKKITEKEEVVVEPAEEKTTQPTQPVAVFPFTPQTAKEVIAQKRKEQTLSAPQADTPVFKKEELIALDGRRLSPFAYEPVIQQKTSVPWSQEELKYGVYYSFIKAGTAYIKNRGVTSVNGRNAYLIQTSAFSASAIDTVFKVRDINYSWIDAETYASLGYTQSLREGNYVRDEWVTFDYPNNRYYGEVKKKGEPREIAGELTSEVLDMLSSLYYVRAQKLEIGKDIVFDIINREERYPLVVKVLKKETVKTSAGKFHCIVVEPQFRGEGIFVSKGKDLKVWLTDDKYKMPVKMQTEVFIGSVSAELLEYKRD